MRNWVASLSLFLCLSSAAGSEELKLARPEALQIFDDANDATFDIAVDPSGAPPQKLTLAPLTVAVDQMQRNELRPVFSGTYLPAADKQGPLLRVTWNLRQMARPATYEIVFSLMDNQNKSQAMARVKLIHPEAQLMTPPAVVLGHVWGSSNTPAALVLRETTGRSRLSGIVILESGKLANNKSDPIDGRIEATQVDEIKPGGEKSVDLNVTGSFPVGTTKGTLVVNAAQLRIPLQVPFEIRERLAWWTLVIALASGVLGSYLLRQRLKALVALSNARLLAAQVREKVDTERNNRTDAELTRQLEGASADLETALREKNATAINDRAAALSKALAGAVEDFEKRRVAIQTDLESERAVLMRGWSLPQSIQTVVNRRLEDIERHLAQAAGDPTSAKEASLRTQGGFSRDLADGLDLYRNFIITRIDLLFSPRGGATALGMNLPAELRPALQAVTFTPGSVLETALRAVHEARVRLRDTLAPAAGSLAQLVQAVRAPLLVLHQDHALRSIEVASNLDAGVPPGDPEALLDRFKVALETIDATLDKVASDANASDAVKGQLARHEYVAALLAMLPQQRAGGYQSGERPAPPEAVSAVPPAITASSQLGIDSTLRMAPARAATPSRSPPAILTVPIASAERDRIEDLQSLVVGLAMVGLGYFVFADAFVGLPRDFFAAIAWGFSADLTVDALIAAISSGGKK